MVQILHLSDIHLSSNKDVIENRIIKIFNSIKNEAKGISAFFIVTSGDIAYSGDKTQYVKAKKLYNSLFKEIKNYLNLDPYLIFVPGNHDCVFNEAKEKVRKLLFKDFATNGFGELDEDTIQLCCEPQNNYFEFTSNIKVKNGDLIFNSPLLKIQTFIVEGKVLKFNCYNTSWHSTLKEGIGSMGFPIEYLYDKIPSIKNELSISILHHPFNWQTPENSKSFREALAKTSEIVISGHEHSHKVSMFSDLNNQYPTIHIESGALQETYKPSVSDFNLIDLDLDAMALRIKHFKYQDGNYKISETSDWKKIEKDKKLKSKPYQIKKEFLAELTNPGASYIHSIADEIKLEDIYIPPFLNDVTIRKEKSSKFLNFINAAVALTLPTNNCNFYKVLLGSEISGKTSIIKYFYKKYYENNFYPIYILAEVIDEVSIDGIKEILAKYFRKQYEELDETFETIDFSKIVILIDDLHKFRFKPSKPILLHNLKSMFSKIIVTGDELMQFESYTDKENTKIDLFDTFDTYVIQEFGPTLRNELITKWYRIGTDYLNIEDRNEFYKKIDFAEANISSIIGKNLIPAYPVYILSILQALETGQQDSSQNNLQAYYYEMLIKSYLRRSLKDKEMIGFYLALCKEYFYFLFETKIRFSPISNESFRKFLRKHEAKYSLEPLNVNEILEALVKARVLKIDTENNIHLTYKYVYYFFVAKYLSDNIEKKDIKRVIELMAERVYRDEYSNVILFLTHLSRNSFIIEKLIEKAKDIFPNITFTKLEEDIGFINTLQESLPELVVKDLKVEEARLEDLDEQEQYELMEKEFDKQKKEDDYDLNEDLLSLDIITHITKALRTLTILGLVTKKNWGELEGIDKNRLAEETYMLGLRTLNNQFILINDSQQALVEHVKSMINKRFVKQRLEKAEIENITKNFIFMLCSASTFGVVKRIINSIGSEKLSKTFDDLKTKYPFNSFKIINLGIELDHYSSFPHSEIEKLKKECEKNPLMFSTLQNLVLNYLHMFEVTHERKSQIYSLLNIKIHDQRVIEGTSKIKKE